MTHGPDHDPSITDDDITKTAFELNSKQFIVTHERNSTPFARVLANTNIRDKIADHFSFMGFDLIFNESEGWFGIRPFIDDPLGPQMTKKQTKTLLLLSLHYGTCVESGDISAFGEAETTVEDFLEFVNDTYPSLNEDDSYTAALNYLKEEFEKRRIIRLGERTDENCEMFIRPFIRDLTGRSELEKIELFLTRKAEMHEQQEYEETEEGDTECN